MATPHVAGAASLLLAQDGARSAVGLKSLILDTADPVASLAGITVTGGRLNVNSAVSCSPTQLKAAILQPKKNFLAYLNEPYPVVAAVNTCGAPVTGAQVGASASSGETLTLYDDGAHGDGAANDGVFAGTWTPVTGGEAILTVTASHPKLGTDTRSVAGRAMERVRYGVAPAQYAWNDISDGTRYPFYDEGRATVPIGFNFTFFGQTYSNITIDANGLLAFGSAPFGNSYYNFAIPNRLAPNNFIAAYWDNLDASRGSVYSKLEGTAPNRTFTVSWVDVGHIWYATGGISFQVVLREGSEDIPVRYRDVVIDDSYTYLNNGATAVVGLENPDGTYGTQYSYYQPSLRNESALLFVRVPTGNLPPIAKPGGAYQTFVNQPLTLDGSASYDPEGSALTYRWDFGDGTTGTGARPTHTYAAKGTYTVTLIVHDEYQDSAAATTTVSVPNRAPIANAGGPYTGLLGPQAILFDGGASYDPDGDQLHIYSYRWDFGDGSIWNIGPTMWHAYYEPGTYTVTLTVSDGFLVSAPSATTVTVINRPPVADAGPDQTVSKNVGTVKLNATNSSDPEGRSWTASWRQVAGTLVTLVDANTPIPYFSVPKSIKPLPMQLVFELKVTDNWGASATDQVVVTVTAP
jgi:PKD repeat protein